MAKAKVVHNVDGCTILFEGKRSKAEPTLGVIKFPGGHVEVSRTDDGTYWSHIYIEDPSSVIDSRIDYDHEGYLKSGMKIPDVPHAEHLQHIAFKTKVTVK